MVPLVAMSPALAAVAVPVPEHTLYGSERNAYTNTGKTEKQTSERNSKEPGKLHTIPQARETM
jgi:hypothetical protein